MIAPESGASRMSTLIDHLRSFNRKERFILLHEALGEDTFTLDEGFRARLGASIGVPVPADAYVAMDYHLDWLQMALYLAATPAPPSPIPNSDLFRANQEDADLLVAFDQDATTHVVLLEAKMETGWTNKQLHSKAQRLRLIFGSDRPGVDLATPHFVLASPKKSERIRTDTWPEWMTRDGVPLWMKLPRPPGLREVTRCTPGGKVSALGLFLRIDS